MVYKRYATSGRSKCGTVSRQNSFAIVNECIRILVDELAEIGHFPVVLRCVCLCNCQSAELWGMAFPEPYMTLFNHSSRAVKDVDPLIKIGGPGRSLIVFLEYLLSNIYS